MNRHLLRIVLVLGLVVSIVSGAGVFAVFSDQATAGASADSGEVAKAADLQLAIPDNFIAGGPWTCGADYHDDLTTLLDATGLQPGGAFGSGVCLRNVGAAPVRLSLSVVDLADVELGCTGDELDADPDCADEAGAGQLSPLLHVRLEVFDCGGPGEPPGQTRPSPR